LGINLDLYLLNRYPFGSSSGYYSLLINWSKNENKISYNELSSKINSKKFTVFASTDKKNLGEEIQKLFDDGDLQQKIVFPAFSALIFKAE
jgi:hypothetical protein